MVKIKEKTVFLTGGYAGIGLSLCKLLLQQGANVFIVDYAPQEKLDKLMNELAGTYGKKIVAKHCDVTNFVALEALFLQAVHDFQNVDIVINNAGVSESNDFWLATSASMKYVLDVDIGAVIEGTRLAVVHLMSKNQPGVIINIASAGGLYPMPFAPVYSAAKYGVVGFSRSLFEQKELRRREIRVHAVCPAFVDTAMMNKGRESNQEMKSSVQQIGVVSPEFIAAAILELLENDQASSVLTVNAKHGARYPFPVNKSKL
jgi:15-hydroxyprostaglandin dehydrogenase (NAD)